MVDIGRALMYAFEDADKVKKILIGGLFNFVLIADWISDGYSLVQTKNIYEGRELPLPDWENNYGLYFNKGMMAFVGGLIYSIPLMLICCCAAVPMLWPMFNKGNDLGLAGMLAIGCGSCLAFLYGIVLLVLMPALRTRYAITEQFNVFFQFGPAWQLINSNTGAYAMAILGILAAGFVAGTVGSITGGLALPFGRFWASLASAHLFGNFAKSAPQIAAG